MQKLRFTRDELFAEHDYSAPHQAAGRRLHGGFVDGVYVPPRSRIRYPAIRAWSQRLEQRGGGLLAADASLLAGPRVPNVSQQQLLLRSGLCRPFWNALTIAGKIEGRGRVLAEMDFPDLQPIIEEDIGDMGIGHLNRGLLAAHGLDEGGEPDRGVGGHDVMWFAARDLVFGTDAFPDVEPPQNIARPEAGRRWMPRLAPQYEAVLSFLMNLLIIEFRAEIGFANTQAVLRTPDVFPNRRAEAEEAAELVERIRTDETIHVESLRLYLGELRCVSVRGEDGQVVAGAELIDPFWRDLVRWATVDQPALQADAQRQALMLEIGGHPDAARLAEAFDRAADPVAGVSRSSGP